MLKNKISVKVVVKQIKSEHKWSGKESKVVGLLPYSNNKFDKNYLMESKIFHTSLDISLFNGETEGYLHNITSKIPKIFIMSRLDNKISDEGLIVPFHATVCPHEAQDYSDDTDTQIDVLDMPEFIYLQVSNFINKNHKDEVFVKRKKRKKIEDTNMFSRKPPTTKRKII
tara:strand:+ start:582 stop:1091 length:510 start_codon:yes stop_codon:yes gene_type:complete